MQEIISEQTKIITDKKFVHLAGYTEICDEGDSSPSLKITIDTEHHTYLHHHKFGEKCYVPATMIMELFAESALWFCKAILNKERIVTGLENFHVLRALVIEPGEKIDAWINLKEVAERGLSDVLSIEIISKRIASNGKTIGIRENAVCHVVVSDKFPESPQITIPAAPYQEYRLPKKFFYEQYFPSLGELFQTQSGNFKAGLEARVLLGIYNLEDKERHFVQGQEHGFVLSPLGYDSCLQYTVFLSRLLALRGRLPVSCQSLTIYKKHPVDGSCSVYIECDEIDDSIMRARFQVFDSRNELVIQTENTVVQYAPVNNSAEIYRNKEMFFDVLNKYKVSADNN